MARWVVGDAGNASSPGGWLRVFGSCLDFTTYAAEQGTRASYGTAHLLEEELRHALRSRDRRQIARIAAELADSLGGALDGDKTHQPTRLQLTPSGGGTPLTFDAVRRRLSPIRAPV